MRSVVVEVGFFVDGRVDFLFISRMMRWTSVLFGVIFCIEDSVRVFTMFIVVFSVRSYCRVV